jgi:hypothetical protein
MTAKTIGRMVAVTGVVAWWWRPPATGSTGRLRGDDPQQQLRKALREAKSVLEIGAHPPPRHPPDAAGGRPDRLPDVQAEGGRVRPRGVRALTAPS